MKRDQRNLGNLAVFGAALAVVVIGVTMSFTHARTVHHAVPERRPVSAPMPPQPLLGTPQALAAAKPDAAATLPVADRPAALPKPSTAKSQMLPKRTAPSSIPAPPPQKRFAARQSATGRGPVPPLLPPLYGPQLTGIAARPPDVLRLTGTMEGRERLAIMRRGTNRYMARLGDIVDGQRVVGISADSVVLQRGTHKRTLRLSRKP
ncbi:MAG: hypothetical protein ABSD48_16760 [Armatimonadota bacterium]